MNKSRMIDNIILIVLLIGVSTFPVNLLVKDIFWYYVIEALLMAAVLLFLLYYERRHPDVVPYQGRFNLRHFIWLLPSFLIVFSNFIYALILKEPYVGSFSYHYIPQAIFIVLNVIVEEYIFRKHLLGNLNHSKKIIRILIAAAIFALCHLTLFFSTFNPASLIVVAYSFGLGIVLGLFYCYTNSLYPCILLHLLFNIINDFLFEIMFNVGTALWYYLINVIVAIVVTLYLLFVYLFVLKKSEEEVFLH